MNLMVRDQVQPRLAVNAHLCTAGDGLWSSVRTAVTIRGVELTVWQSAGASWGELRAYFDPQLWDTDTVGLIYTDSLWIEGWREWLALATPLAASAVAGVDYSEQGMQGADYVSMDADAVFVAAWQAAELPVATTIVCEV